MKYIDLLRLREKNFIYHTPEESLWAIVEISSYSIVFVKNQTPEICLKAVKQDGKALQWVTDQTEEMCLEAYKQDPDFIKYIRIDIEEENLKNERDKYLCFIDEQESLEAVRKHGFYLQYVKHQTPEICLEAVRQNGWALVYVINQTEEICLEAYKKNSNSIIYIRDTLEDYRKRRLNLIQTIE